MDKFLSFARSYLADADVEPDTIFGEIENEIGHLYVAEYLDNNPDIDFKPFYDAFDVALGKIGLNDGSECTPENISKFVKA